MSQTLAADIEPVTRPKISFAGVNKFYGNNRSGAATMLALDDFSLGIAPEESQRGPRSRCRFIASGTQRPRPRAANPWSRCRA